MAINVESKYASSYPSTAGKLEREKEFTATESTPLLDPERAPSRKCGYWMGSSSDKDDSLSRSSQSFACSSQTIIADPDGSLEDNSTLRSHAPSPPLTLHFQDVSLTLRNSGSVARDHLASERTFLAYMRTSLAISSAGIALVQLFSASGDSGASFHRLPLYISILGAGAVVVGIMVLLIGTMRYFMIQAALVKGLFPVARFATAMIALLLAILVTMTFGMLITGSMPARKR